MTSKIQKKTNNKPTKVRWIVAIAVIGCLGFVYRLKTSKKDQVETQFGVEIPSGKKPEIRVMDNKGKFRSIEMPGHTESILRLRPHHLGKSGYLPLHPLPAGYKGPANWNKKNPDFTPFAESYAGHPKVKTVRKTNIASGKKNCPVGEGASFPTIGRRADLLVVSVMPPCKTSHGRITEAYIPLSDVTLSNAGGG